MQLLITHSLRNLSYGANVSKERVNYAVAFDVQIEAKLTQTTTEADIPGFSISKQNAAFV